MSLTNRRFLAASVVCYSALLTVSWIGWLLGEVLGWRPAGDVAWLVSGVWPLPVVYGLDLWDQPYLVRWGVPDLAGLGLSVGVGLVLERHKRPARSLGRALLATAGPVYGVLFVVAWLIYLLGLLTQTGHLLE